jgi:hypothetical protein
LQVDPRPSEIVKSLRGLGYRPATAIADLIDNSLSAGATVVQVEFLWHESNPTVRVTDNGRGMTSPELIEAMRFGRDPAATRSADDLGRFGLGLKTASLSQARVLTVCSKSASHAAATFRWDIDHIEACDDWDLQNGAALGSESLLDGIVALPSGTIVLWENMDSLLAATDRSIDSLFEVAEAVSKHVGMVFHRFLVDNRVMITVNSSEVRAWDPFMSEHPDCMVSGPEVLQESGGDHEIVVTGYVLPPRSRLSEDEYERSAGPGGWIVQEGFYVYRAERLVVAGGWLGIGRAGKPWRLDRSFALARISIDITNSVDLDWGIDVRKSIASPPAAFHRSLRQLAEEIRRRSRSAFRAFRAATHETAVADEAAGPPIWMASRNGPVPQFRINRRHPAVKSVRDATRDGSKLRSLLNLLDKESPVQPRGLTISPSAVQVEANRALQESSIRPLVRAVYYSLRNARGLTAADAKAEMLSQATFRDHETLVVVTIEEYEREMKG